MATMKTVKDITPSMRGKMNMPLRSRMLVLQYEHYLYWIIERMRIYYSRRANMPPPWTQDTILAHNFFTTPFRELDKTTAHYRERVRNPICALPTQEERDHILFATVAYRWFNLSATGEFMLGDNPCNQNFYIDWDFDVASHLFKERSDAGTKLFTSGYIIKLENAKPKYLSVCEQLQKWWELREVHIQAFRSFTTLQEAHKYIAQIKHLGKFMAYEIVCDLMYTHFLQDATDKMTWCNPGPGCTRGILRLKGVDFNGFARNSIKLGGDLILNDCRYLLERVPRDIRLVLSGRLTLKPPRGVGYNREAYNPPMPEEFLTEPDLQHMDMRFIEHTLCEFDKYERVYYQDGKSKRTYTPSHENTDDQFCKYGG